MDYKLILAMSLLIFGQIRLVFNGRAREDSNDEFYQKV